MEIEEDISFFRKEIVFQRMGWVLMVIALVLGSAGLFGTGALSHQKTITANAQIAYEKYLRYEHESEITIKFRNSPSNTIISIPLSYLQDFGIEKMIPEPQTQEIANGSIHYHFNTAGRVEIRLFVKALATGNSIGEITINNEKIPLSHFIYP